MLIKFRVDNYRSFGTEQTLDMTAGQVRNHPDHVMDVDGAGILASTMMFGANASGKSNMVSAMAQSRAFIVSGAPIDPDNRCRTMGDTQDRPTFFEFTFETGGRVLSYGFGMNLGDGKVVEEWLNVLGRQSKRSLYDRGPDGIVTDFKLRGDQRNSFDVYTKEATDSGGLILRALSRTVYDEGSDLHVANLAMRWFTEKLVVIPAGAVRTSETGKDLDMLVSMMRSYNTGVSDVVFEEVGEDLITVKGNPVGLGRDAVVNLWTGRDLFRIRPGEKDPIVDRVMFRHGEASFSFHEESSGTRRLFDLAPIIDRDSGEDMTYVIDEMDMSLHPQLTKRFVKDFLSMAKGCRRQLIATVHESRLMDLNLLRRDEIWFVEMKSTLTSVLFSLEDFNERSDRRVDRAYLDGRYGAVPMFMELFPDIEDDDETH